eukprot:755508-Hanusia_phi.AAC.2
MQSDVIHCNIPSSTELLACIDFIFTPSMSVVCLFEKVPLLAMGRIGEVIARTWQTAAKMKQQR